MKKFILQNDIHKLSVLPTNVIHKNKSFTADWKLNSVRKIAKQLKRWENIKHRWFWFIIYNITYKAKTNFNHEDWTFENKPT